jgi:hypothetical protein
MFEPPLLKLFELLSDLSSTTYKLLPLHAEFRSYTHSALRKGDFSVEVCGL